MEGFENIVWFVLLVIFWIYRSLSAKGKKKQRKLRERQAEEQRASSSEVEEVTEETEQEEELPASLDDFFKQIFEDPRKGQTPTVDRAEELPEPPIVSPEPSPIKTAKKEVEKQIYGDYSKGTLKASDLTKKVPHASALSKKIKHAADLSREMKHARDLNKDAYHAIDRSKRSKKKGKFDLKQAIIHQVILERPYK